MTCKLSPFTEHILVKCWCVWFACLWSCVWFLVPWIHLFGNLFYSTYVIPLSSHLTQTSDLVTQYYPLQKILATYASGPYMPSCKRTTGNIALSFVIYPMFGVELSSLWHLQVSKLPFIASARVLCRQVQHPATEKIWIVENLNRLLFFQYYNCTLR